MENTLTEVEHTKLTNCSVLSNFDPEVSHLTIGVENGTIHPYIRARLSKLNAPEQTYAVASSRPHNYSTI